MKSNTTSITLVSMKSYFLLILSRHLDQLKKKSGSVNFWILFLGDTFCVLLAYFAANYMRYEASFWQERQLYHYATVTLILCVKLPMFYLMGLYNGMWRYTSLRDMQNIIKAVFLSSAIVVSIMLLINRFQGFSRAVFIMDALICLLLIGGSRISIRYFLRHKRSQSVNLAKRKKRLLLIGAGDAAEQAVREIGYNPKLPYEVVGFVDDNKSKIGMRIHGIPILGTTDDLVEIANHAQAEEILIAVVALKGSQMKRLVALCQLTGLPFKVLPGLGELIDGKISIKTMRDISYHDLLGREEVNLDQAQIGGYLKGKTVLITGAGGSIGSELCRQIIRFSPGRIILFDSSEENLYSIQMELIHELNTLDAVTVLGKVQDVELLDLVFRRDRPSVVFHAAAYKHVPLLECNPWQAVYNNILASQLLIEAAILFHVERFVLVSTDKAVRPTSVMGASKRITEMLIQAYNKSKWDKKISRAWKRMISKSELSALSNCQSQSHQTFFMAVRFGNVLGSSGSVIPLFKRQIELGGPVTVTHPEITRYFMSVDEAAQLILQAGAMGEEAEIFILKMGQPVSIDLMAKELIRLAGKEPDVEIEIKYTGLREGEKLYEELITEGEGIVETEHEKIMVLKGDSFITNTKFQDYIERLVVASKAHDGVKIRKIMQDITKDYHPEIDMKGSAEQYVN